MSNRKIIDKWNSEGLILNRFNLVRKHKTMKTLLNSESCTEQDIKAIISSLVDLVIPASELELKVLNDIEEM